MSKYIKLDDATRGCGAMQRFTGIEEAPFEYAVDVLKKLPTIEASEDCISRQAVIDILDYHAGREKEFVKMLPSVLPVVPSGEWKHDTHYGLKLPEHQCSICGFWEYADTESNYCPNCGADMRGESE